MSALSDLSERLRALLFRSRLEKELDEELRFHLEREAEERARGGADSEAARRQAALAFGGIERTKDEVREARGVTMLEDAVADMRYAARSLAHNPAFTAAAVLVLGLGIGAATTVFSVVRGVLLAELPYAHGDRLVRILTKNPATTFWQLSTVDVQAIAARQRSFDAFGTVQATSAALVGAGSPTRVAVGRASAGFFQALEVRPLAGRLIETRDEAMDAPPVVVVSYALAERSLGGAASAIGRTITLDGVGHTVVGVLPAGREELAGLRARAWPALKLQVPARRGPFWLRSIARLRDGVSVEMAGNELAGISQRLFPQWKAGYQDSTTRFTPVPLRDVIVGTADQAIGLFATAVALVLLIAIANVATLMLVRASAREHELAVRTALGATRGRLARLLVTESLVVTILAGMAGLAVAAFGLKLLPLIAPRLPRSTEIMLGYAGAVFAGVLALASGVLIGVVPVASVLARRVTALRSEAGRTGSGRRTNLIRGALVSAEFALALPLLLGAGVLLNSFVRLQRVDPGYDPANVFSVSVALPAARYTDPAAVLRFLRLAELRAQASPGVSAVGLSTDLPPDNFGDVNDFDLPDHPAPTGGPKYLAPWATVTAGFFHALGIPLVEGRVFTDGDSATAPPVVIVSRAWASHYFKGESAVGRRIISGGCTSCPPTIIVGVVGDVKFAGLTGNGDGVYQPVSQAAPTTVNLVVRGSAAPAAVFPQLRSGLAALDPELPLVMTSLDDQIALSLDDPRRWTELLAAFAVSAALLAALGIFGLMSYVVRQRRREIGVRLALGAEPGSVARMIVARGMRHALLGITIGVGASLLEARWLRALLFEVAPTDPLTLAAALALLLLTALLACWVPGRRAARIRPLEAIASE